jgi:hypothetical protein
MRLHTITGFIFVIVLSSACKKEKDEIPSETPTPTPTTYENYTNLKVGNYWIYQEYSVDSLGNGSATSFFDSCYVEKDTIVNGNTYHKMVKLSSGGWPEIETLLLRDSLSYTVNQKGKVYFSSADFTSVFNRNYMMASTSDTLCVYSSKMINLLENTNVPAGVFSTLEFRTTYKMFPPYTYGGTYRHLHLRYAKNIGLITETMLFFVSSPMYNERRLVRYHLN